MTLINKRKTSITADINVDRKKLKTLEKEGLVEIYHVRHEKNNIHKTKNIINPIFVLGFTTFPMVLSDGINYKKILSILGTDNINDSIQIEAHLRSNNDIFVTEDKGILRNKEILRQKFPNLMVLTFLQLKKHLKL